MSDIDPKVVEEEYLAEHRASLARLGPVYGAVAVLAFSSLYPIDPLLPNLIVPLRTLQWIRTGVVAFNLVCFGLAFTAPVKRHPDAWVVFYLIHCSAAVIVLTVCTGGTVSPYREAMLALFFFMPTLLPWRFKYFAPAASFCTGLYQATLWATGTLGAVWAWASNIVILTACCCMASLTPFFLERFRRASVKSRLLLAREREALANAFQTIQEQQNNVNEDLDQARLFQQKILRPLPVKKNIDFAALYRPADFLGGDFYDVAEMGPDWYRVFMVDVTGHGTQAAMRTMILQQQLERASRAFKTPWELMAAINDTVVEAFGSMVVNYCALCLDLRREGTQWRVTGSNAGLPEPTVLQGTSLTTVGESGTYQGIFSAISYPQFERTLEAGDGIIIATDGIVDLLEPAQGGTWIPDGARFTGTASPSAKGTLDGLVASLPPSAPSPDRLDDLTMLVIRIPQAGSPAA